MHSSIQESAKCNHFDYCLIIIYMVGGHDILSLNTEPVYTYKITHSVTSRQLPELRSSYLTVNAHVIT